MRKIRVLSHSDEVCVGVRKIRVLCKGEEVGVDVRGGGEFCAIARRSVRERARARDMQKHDEV